MVDLLGQCYEKCTISGENWGAFQSLAAFDSKVRRTAAQSRGDEHAKVAWRKVFEIASVRQAEEDLVSAMLNPEGSSCWGFKEIRHGRGEHRLQLELEIEFLS